MTAADLIALIRKRHEGPAWIVVTEVANGTGGHAKRHADALALGLWPSHGHAIIGYETKVSREDVKKELRDPSKADPVGKFCDEWNLVISDESIIDVASDIAADGMAGQGSLRAVILLGDGFSG